MSNPMEFRASTSHGGSSIHAEVTVDEITRETTLAGVGKLTQHQLVTNSGFEYSATVGAPETKATEVPVVIGTPWMMHAAGLPSEMARRALQLGFPTILVGAESNLDRLPGLGMSAHNLHAVVDALAEQSGVGFNRREVISTGMSRAAMLCISFAALADQYDRQVIYGDWIAPCFPSHPSITSPFGYWLKAPGEAMSVAKLLFTGQLTNFLASFDSSGPGIVQASLSAPGLVNGDAGKNAETLPDDTSATVTLFSSDIMGNSGKWEEIFERYPNVQINRQRGGHSELGDRHTFDDWSNRMGVIASMLALAEERNERNRVSMP